MKEAVSKGLRNLLKLDFYEARVKLIPLFRASSRTKGSSLGEILTSARCSRLNLSIFLNIKSISERLRRFCASIFAAILCAYLRAKYSFNCVAIARHIKKPNKPSPFLPSKPNRSICSSPDSILYQNLRQSAWLI